MFAKIITCYNEKTFKEYYKLKYPDKSVDIFIDLDAAKEAKKIFDDEITKGLKMGGYDV